MFDVVCTTISGGGFLRHWQRTITEAELQSEVRLVVIPDLNTPPELYERVTELVAAGINVLCPAPDEQAAFLDKLGEKNDFIPWHSDNRRNVGYLMSWRDHADVVISVDDDNLPLDPSFFFEHRVVDRPPALHYVEDAVTGWFNPCALIGTQPPVTYPRGYPYFARGRARGSCTWDTVDVTINAGLWLGDPDVDAITRIGAKPVAWGIQGDSVVLSKSTWMPVNSQNTAIRRDVIPAYYFARMGSFGGRFGDMFSGYFAEACAKHLGHSVRVGTPLVMQERNKHDLLHDLELEFPFIKMFERLLEWLPEVELEGTTYRDAYESLSCALNETAESYPDDREKGVLHRLAYHMRYWLKLVDQIGRQ